ncbi:hypothetical protein H9636_16200 [Ureibacillus sp. Re31]|uniref:Uncharacterized protein n=1 Tax=Ureibacillus galli TaxID=2762222 RepID=A0ABR8XG38_9BACL|nr:hypothetical protein [Ureibacillus galli]MBD8028190.1 hypothetical protein [Ureibacillus galli]
MTNVLNDIKQITEVVFANDAQQLLNDGWTLEGVYQRSDIINGIPESTPVYVFVKKDD